MAAVELLRMSRNTRAAGLLALGLAGALLAQLPEPTPSERQQARQIAALPADRTPAAVAEMEQSQITPGLVKAIIDISTEGKNPAERVRVAQLAIAVARRGNLGEMEGMANYALAEAFFAQADYYDGVESLDVSVARYQQAGSPPRRVAGAFANRAIGRLHLGDLTGALEDDQRALQLARQSGDEVSVARILNGLGNAYKELGDFRHSLEAFEQSLKIAREKKEKLGEAFILNNIGSLYSYQGDYRLAIDYQLRSAKIKEALGKTREAITSLVNLGDSYDHAGLQAEARQTLDKALRLARQADQKMLLALALKFSAHIDLERRRDAWGFAQLEEARSLFHETGERLDEADILADIAQARFDRRQYSEAVTAALDSAALARQCSGKVVLEDAAAVLGQAYHALGKPAEARAALDESIAAIEEVRETVSGGDTERESFLAGHVDAYRELLAIEMEQGRTAPAFRLAEQAKGRVLLDLLHGGRPLLDGVLSASERRRELALRGRLAALRAQQAGAGESGETLDSGPLRDLDARIQKARLDLFSFRSALYAAHPELRLARGDVSPVTVAEAGALLPGPDAALLEYALTPHRTYLFVIVRGPDGPVLRTHVLPLGQRTLEAEVVRFREQIATRDPGFVSVARKLHTWLLAPAAKELAGKTALVIVPDGELWRLPFQALQTASGRFLVQDTAISYTPSLSVMHAELAVRPAGAGRPRTVMVLADPSGDTPEADREAQAIATLYGEPNSHVWRGPEATSNVFRSEAGRFDVLHLAAHGVFDDRNPMVSHIVLAGPAKGSGEDGWVEAGEVRSMQLKAGLVVLSGCETARGHFENGEGAVGLSWAFLAAGARAAVASQWRVESASTSDLMVAFHRGLLAGSSGAEALRHASLQLLGTEQYHHPFYWAGFVLLGAG